MRLKYHHLCQTAPLPTKSIILTTEACKSACAAFNANMVRAIGVVMVPAFAAYVGTSLANAMLLTNLEVTKVFNPPEIPKEDEDRHHAIMTRHMKDAISLCTDSDLYCEALGHMALNFDDTLNKIGGDIKNSMQSLMSSVLILAWSATEVLISDLWINALNEHPGILASLGCAEKSMKQITLGVIDMEGFDLRKKMGTILSDRYKFRTLDGARSAYVDAFTKDQKAVIAATQNPAFDALSQLRHALVHASGTMDGEFWKKTAALPKLAKIRAAGEGKPISVDGEIVRELLEDATKGVADLLQAVDAWLVAHP